MPRRDAMGVDDSKGPGMSMSPQITAKDVEDYVSRFEWFRNPDRQGYWAAAKDRLVTTLNLIPRLPNPEQVRVLEIGGMPYFMTALIEHLFGYTVEVINEPTWERGEDGNVEILESDDGDRHEIHYKTLNIEYDHWPWEDGRFDIVLYCEVIEHPVYDHAYAHPPWLEPAVRALIRAGRLKRRLDVIYLLGTPVGEPKWAYPDTPPHAIYDDTQGYRQRVALRTVRMIDQESSALLSGFYRVEPWGGGVRWTMPKAQLVLDRQGHDKLSVTMYTGMNLRGPQVEGWVAVGDEAAPKDLQRHEFKLPSESWETLTFPLPDGCSDKVLVEIGVNQPMVPQELAAGSPPGSPSWPGSPWSRRRRSHSHPPSSPRQVSRVRIAPTCMARSW